MVVFTLLIKVFAIIISVNAGIIPERELSSEFENCVTGRANGMDNFIVYKQVSGTFTSTTDELSKEVNTSLDNTISLCCKRDVPYTNYEEFDGPPPSNPGLYDYNQGLPLHYISKPIRKNKYNTRYVKTYAAPENKPSIDYSYKCFKANNPTFSQ